MQSSPQPIPYQGSKRQQVPVILRYLPKDTATLWEPFVGSGALTIGAAASQAAEAHVVGDSLAPLVEIWELILRAPDELCDRYERLWNAQLADPRAYYDRVRDAYNDSPEPAKLLYLIARCVKNAVRF
ncbi:MAG: DNA adenine methylase, partial [Myxococcales bacterium]|nr:DNA adenine methylase [Myxococcales bacterium]